MDTKKISEKLFFVITFLLGNSSCIAGNAGLEAIVSYDNSGFKRALVNDFNKYNTKKKIFMLCDKKIWYQFAENRLKVTSKGQTLVQNNSDLRKKLLSYSKEATTAQKKIDKIHKNRNSNLAYYFGWTILTGYLAKRFLEYGIPNLLQNLTWNQTSDIPISLGATLLGAYCFRETIPSMIGYWTTFRSKHYTEEARKNCKLVKKFYQPPNNQTHFPPPSNYQPPPSAPPPHNPEFEDIP